MLVTIFIFVKEINVQFFSKAIYILFHKVDCGDAEPRFREIKDRLKTG